MRACKKCGLSLGQLATFCPVCGTVADPEVAPPAMTPEPIPPEPQPPAPVPEPEAEPTEPESEPAEPEPEVEPEVEPEPEPAEPEPEASAPEPELEAPAPEPETEPEPKVKPPVTEPEPPAALTPAELEAEARACEEADPARAVALYRGAVVAHLEASDDPLADRSAARDVQRLFDRLSIALKRDGLLDEALEEIDTAAYLGLVDDPTRGTKAQREALAKRRAALRKAAS